jgi:polyisoprenoid-binding protein YceI
MRKSFLIYMSLVLVLGITNQVLANNDKNGSKKEVDITASKVEWKGKKLIGEHVGNVSLKSGQLSFEGSILKGGSFVLDMNSITNLDLTDAGYNKKLVNHLKSEDFFSVNNFPTANFEITKAEQKGGDNYLITGNLTIKGITHPLSFPAKISNKDGIVTAIAEMKFDRSKYNVKYGSKSFFENIGDNIIYDDVEMKINLITSGKVAAK